MILVLDNYDSFTFNLVQLLGDLARSMPLPRSPGESSRDIPTIHVVRNDVRSAQELLDLHPSHIVVSPGPCTPIEAGISVELIRQCPHDLPLLGVCLGHQALGHAFGGEVVRAPIPMHGKVSSIRHEGRGIFADLPSPFDATRYHSLVVCASSLPDELDVLARTDDDLIMGMRHRFRSLHGVQFHPESIMTHSGRSLLRAFLALPSSAGPPISPSTPAVV